MARGWEWLESGGECLPRLTIAFLKSCETVSMSNRFDGWLGRCM